MSRSTKFDEIFKPHPDFKTLYFNYLILGILVFYLSWAIPTNIIVFLASEYGVTLLAMMFLYLPLIAIAVFTAYWIPKFYLSLSYLLTDSDIIIERGVWWKHKSIVPYNRVTNIDVVQGPLSRRLGLGKISIQTAGFSAGGGSGSAKVAEATIMGVKNYEEVKDYVISKVKRLRPMAIEAEAEFTTFEDVNLKILDELKKIRQNLEKNRK